MSLYISFKEITLSNNFKITAQAMPEVKMFSYKHTMQSRYRLRLWDVLSFWMCIHLLSWLAILLLWGGADKSL